MSTPKRYENAKWEDVPESLREEFKRMLETGKGIYLYGPVGCGKTHICWAFKQKYDDTQSYRYCRLWNVVDLMHEIKADFDRDQYSKRRPEEELTDPENKRVLILDDMGAEKATDFVAETLYRIINHRYIHCLPTVITSNLSLQELADKIGERSTSRIVEMCEPIKLNGGDRRQTK